MEKCPHCGGEPTVDKALRDGYRGMEDDPDAWAFFVICKSCAGQGGWVKNESGAIRMWNMRMTDADNPKDKEEIKKWKNAFYTLDEVSKNQAIEITELKYGEIARLRKAVQEIEYLADRITIENGSIARAILKLAREALEGK